MSHTGKELKTLLKAFKETIIPPKLDYAGVVKTMAQLAERARKDGVLSLQESVDKLRNPIMRQGLIMAVDGDDPDKIKIMLQFMSEEAAARYNKAAGVLETCGGYMPTVGIMGTVLGLIAIMRNLDRPETLGPAIAVAFLATLYGVGFANMLVLPMGAKLKAIGHELEHYNDMVIAGVIGIQSGDNPRTLQEKLQVYAGGGK